MVFSSLFKSHQQRPETSNFDASVIMDNKNESKEEKKSVKKRKRKKKPKKTLETANDDAVEPKTNNQTSQATSEKSDEDRDKQKRKRPRNKENSNKWKPPTAAALELSAVLKEHSKHKRLQEALNAYWDKANDAVRDGHHGCIMVDCCSRCGAIHEGERVIEEMGKSGAHVNMETKTALLKGYAHAGQLHKAMSLFEAMCGAKGKRDLPNVRTLNTLLRGCLWTAATENEDGVVAGGVVSSEPAWKMFQTTSRQRLREAGKVDLSSYEYTVMLLCQGLRSEEATARVEELKQAYGVSDKVKNVEKGVMESLAVCYQSLSRMYLLLNEHEEVKRAVASGLEAVDEALKQSTNSGNDLNETVDAKAKRVLEGGKQAWRRSVETEQGIDSRRFESNTIFRSHRLHEIKDDLLVIRQSYQNESCMLSSADFVRHLLSRLHFLSGGGTTDLSTIEGVKPNDNEDLNVRLVRNLWTSFGLRAALEKAQYTSKLPAHQSDVTEKHVKKIQKFASFRDGVSEDGYFNFQRIFEVEGEDSVDDKPKQPLDIELGSGFGEWIVQQAKHNPSRNYVAIELRADRVAQIFSKSIATGTGPPLKNLCIVGSECGSFLRSYVQKNSVSTVFINHPEPPTQTYGVENLILQNIMEGHSEPAHMLNRKNIEAAASCLQADKSARLVIVTDNRWYARLICATLVSVVRNGDGILQSMGSDFGQRSGLRALETFRLPDSSPENQVIMFQGQPCEEIGHSLSSGVGSSYFDRLWKAGAGKHAEQNARFIIMMHRTSPLNAEPETQSDENQISDPPPAKRKSKHESNQVKKRRQR